MCIEYHRWNKNTFCVLATQLWQLSVEISWISAPVAEHWGCGCTAMSGAIIGSWFQEDLCGILCIMLVVVTSCIPAQEYSTTYVYEYTNTHVLSAQNLSHMHILAFWQLHKSGNCLGNALPPDKQLDRHRHTCTGTHAHVTLPAILQVSC